MTRQEIVKAVYETVEEMREMWVPNPVTRYITSTGNMAFNALVYFTSGNQVIVKIDGRAPNEGRASYAVYTEYPWISPRWHGRKNPNEGWWGTRFYNEFFRRLTKKLKGTVR